MTPQRSGEAPPGQRRQPETPAAVHRHHFQARVAGELAGEDLEIDAPPHFGQQHGVRAERGWAAAPSAGILGTDISGIPGAGKTVLAHWH